MSKNIKAIKCPNCGSVENTEIKPDYYKCSNCGSEYFLDNDDININVNHISQPVQASPLNTKKILTIVVAIIMVPLVMIIANLIVSNNASKNIVELKEDKKYDFPSAGSTVYQNTQTGKAVFMRLGRENIESPDHSYDYVNTHVVFIDPVTKKQFKDEILLPHIRRLDNYFPTFRVYGDENVYMVYPGARLFRVDREANRFIEVTKSLFKNHPELSMGLATIQLNENSMNLLTNDGNKYYYVPATDFLTTDSDAETKELKLMEKDTSFQFDHDQLIKLTPKAPDADRRATNLTPGRRYFDPDIIYQDETYLIIATGANASPDAPALLQSIDRNTGKIIWTLPAKTFSYSSAARCKEGIAVEYSSGEDQDYISGVLVISPTGTIVSDYLIKRNE